MGAPHARRPQRKAAGAPPTPPISPSDAATSAQSYEGTRLAVSLADVTRAQRVIGESALHTPLVEGRDLCESSGSRVFLKLDNSQRTGAFKMRGAANKIADLSDQERARGVITASAGNHAQSGGQRRICVSRLRRDRPTMACDAMASALWWSCQDDSGFRGNPYSVFTQLGGQTTGMHT